MKFTPRDGICSPNERSRISRYIPVSGDTSVRGLRISTTNASTDGNFPKTWEYEDGEWRLYKIRSAIAARCEVGIRKTLFKCGRDAAEYRYTGTGRTRVKSRCFLAGNEFFEPYESFRYAFDDRSDDDAVILCYIASPGAEYETASVSRRAGRRRERRD